MRRHVALSVLSLGWLLVGCHAHPLPDDVTRLSTYDIVDRIRCEARLAILDYAPEKMFETAEIGYEFQFQITEINNANLTNLGFRYPFDGGIFNLSINAGTSKNRVGDRNFKIVENFADLKRVTCLEGPHPPNLRYPITGSIGLGEVINTYARLERRTNLTGHSANALPVFSDKLKFTTSFGGGVKPSLTLTPRLGSFRLIEASADLNAQRIDLHMVNIAIARDNRNDPRARSSLRAVAPRFSYVNPLAPTAVQEQVSARDRVLLELDRQRLLDLDVFRVVVP